MKIKIVIILLTIPIIFNATLQQSTVDSAYQKAMGDFHLRRNEISKAVKNYQLALKLNPKNIECHYKLGKIYIEQRLFSYAAEKFKMVIDKKEFLKNKGMILDSWINLANLYFLKGKTLIGKTRKNIYFVYVKIFLEKIIKSFKKGEYFQSNLKRFKINKDYYLSKAYYILGRYYRDQNRPSRYINSFKKAIKHYNRLKQIRNNTYKIAFRKIDCYYILWEYYTDKKNNILSKRYNDLINQVIKEQQDKIETKNIHNPDQINTTKIKQYKAIASYALKIKKNGINSIFNFLPSKKK